MSPKIISDDETFRADWTICGSESRPACLNFFNIPNNTDSFFAEVSNGEGDLEHVEITYKEGSSKTLTAKRLVTFKLSRTTFYRGIKAHLCGNSKYWATVATTKHDLC